MRLSKQSYLIWTYCCFSISLAKHCQVTHIQALELPKFHRENSTNVLLSWKNEDCGRSEVIKISAIHLRYLGCQRNKRDFEKTEVLTDGESDSAIIENLHHYSEYRLELCPGSGCPLSLTEVNVTTKPSVPRVRVVESFSELYDYRDNETSLTFNWRPPPSSQCHLYQSQLGGYHYQLVGLDDWNEEYQAGKVSSSQTKVTLNNLKPFSRYNLFVYVTNSEGKYHQDFFVKFEKRTKAGQPSPPVNLSISETEGELTLFWRSPQPPSGELSHFEISMRDSRESQINRKIITVEETEYSKDTFHAKLGSVEENIKYYFKIRSYNKDYDNSSDWSTEMDFQISSTQFSKATPGLICLILAIFIFILVCFLILMKIGYKMRKKHKLRKEIEQYFGNDWRASMRCQSPTETDKTYIDINTDDGYAIIGGPSSQFSSSSSSSSSSNSERNRSPSDPLPEPNDIPGYLKTDFQRYKIFKPDGNDV